MNNQMKLNSKKTFVNVCKQELFSRKDILIFKRNE